MITEKKLQNPTYCPNCKTNFEMKEGYASEKWHPDYIICNKCYQEESEEIERDEKILKTKNLKIK